MKSKFIAILTLSTLAFFATASAKSEASDMKSVKTEISKEISTEVKTEVANTEKSDFKKMREERKEARKGLLEQFKLAKDELKVEPPAKPEVLPPTPKSEEELQAEREAHKAEMEAKIVYDDVVDLS